MLNNSIFHSYDIRGEWNKEWDFQGVEDLARAIIKKYSPKTVAIGRDMRLSSGEIFSAFTDTFFKYGVEIWDLDQISTDISYFVSGKFKPDLTIMITASHNPPEYNGLKITLPGGESLSYESGFSQLQKLAKDEAIQLPEEKQGKIIKKDVYPDYTDSVLSLINKKNVKPLKIVVDAGNGMAGKVLPRVFQNLNVQFIPLFFELDGSFPNHLANPLLPEAVVSLREKVLEEKAYLGAGFDGDGDRMVLMDETGRVLSGTVMTAMLASTILSDNPDRVVCYNAICGRVVPQTILEKGGRPIRTPVGYSIIKKIMREKEAVFAGEHSYHFFFPKLYFADSGMTALAISLELLSKQGIALSEIRKKYDIYPQSGEINFQAEDKQRVMEKVEEKFKGTAKSIDHLDGLSVWFDDWWFNLRPSNTESFLRLNIEADNKDVLDKQQAELINLIESIGGKKA
jgi:phosphomannomutase